MTLLDESEEQKMARVYYLLLACLLTQSMATEEAEERLEDMGEYGSGSAPRKSVRRGKEVPAMPSFLRVAG